MQAPFAATSGHGHGHGNGSWSRRRDDSPGGDFFVSAAVLALTPPVAFNGPADAPRAAGRATPLQYEAAAQAEDVEEEGSAPALAAAGLVVASDGKHVEALPIEKLVRVRVRVRVRACACPRVRVRVSVFACGRG